MTQSAIGLDADRIAYCIASAVKSPRVTPKIVVSIIDTDYGKPSSNPNTKMVSSYHVRVINWPYKARCAKKRKKPRG